MGKVGGYALLVSAFFLFNLGKIWEEGSRYQIVYLSLFYSNNNREGLGHINLTNKIMKHPTLRCEEAHGSR
jgi:hypothetical protein